MSELIVYQGNRDISVEPSIKSSYLYRIGSGNVTGRKFIQLNNTSRLNALAEEIRDDYCQWIYLLHTKCFCENFRFSNLSLFFLTDLSCKRTEFFNTYNTICNLLIVRECLKDIELSKVYVIGADRGFVRAIQSIFPGVEFEITNLRASQAKQWRRLGADILYLSRLCGVSIINILERRRDLLGRRKVGTLFYSVFPQMFSTSGVDSKYGSFVGKEDDYAVSIVTDGMHQAVTVADYIRFSRKAREMRFMLIDRFLRLRDCVVGLYWFVTSHWHFFRSKKQIFVFKDIDVSELISVELCYSVSRVFRLCTIMEMFRRFLKATSPKEFVYYPVEYPLGRMVSYICSSVSQDIVRTGFQMSTMSPRRLEQFLAPREASIAAPFLHNAPIPDRILAEDEAAAQIYRQSGYKNVEIMDKVYRYEYLDRIALERRKGWALIVPGLHDGQLMLDVLHSEIQGSSNNTYVLKPHPRADNRYVTYYQGISNILVMNNPVHELLAIVEGVFVTYSSVGVEAERLGLPVTIIDITGRINTSPLVDVATSVVSNR